MTDSKRRKRKTQAVRPRRPCDLPRMPCFERRLPEPRQLAPPLAETPSIVALTERLQEPRCPACRLVLRFQIDWQGAFFSCLCTEARQRLPADHPADKPG